MLVALQLCPTNVALQLCPTWQFGPLTYQPIEWGFVSSNQSAFYNIARKFA